MCWKPNGGEIKALGEVAEGGNVGRGHWFSGCGVDSPHQLPSPSTVFISLQSSRQPQPQQMCLQEDRGAIVFSSFFDCAFLTLSFTLDFFSPRAFYPTRTPPTRSLAWPQGGGQPSESLSSLSQESEKGENEPWQSISNLLNHRLGQDKKTDWGQQKENNKMLKAGRKKIAVLVTCG